MPCSPNDNQINVEVPPPPTIPGFGIPFSPIQIPLPQFDLPTKLIEDFAGLIQALGALFPSGEFLPIPDLNMKGIFDFLSNVLTQIAPYLSLYNFFLALLNMIKCIIDVLCAIPNPFAVAEKLIVLFTECLPPFLNLFPFLALIAMIIALLLLILALIEYIINTILAIIEAILRNIEIFVDAARYANAEAILAAVNKIAMVLCFLQNVLAFLLAIAAIINVIKSIAQFAGVTFCSDEDEDGCCPVTICPPFIKNTPDGIPVSSGQLIYLKQVGLDPVKAFKLDPNDPEDAITIETFNTLGLLSPIRKERWQIFDKSIGEAQYPISSIYTPVIPIVGGDFWAETVTITKKTSPQRAQYTADLTFEVNPSQFDNTFTDTKGIRTFKAKDCVVVERPYQFAYKYNSTENVDAFATRDLTKGFTGVLSVSGGKIFEIGTDGSETEYMIGSEQATLDNFVYKTPTSSLELPSTDDAIVIDNIQFIWKPNAPALAGYNVTTFGCIPEVSIEKNILNSIIVAEGIQPVADKLPALPDVEGTYQCVNSALETFRKDISPAGAAIFQSAAIACLNKLKADTINTITAAVIAAASPYKTEFTLDSDLQFTNAGILVNVFLKDGAGTLLTSKLPEECATSIASKISADISLGTISDFAYDGISSFVANLFSTVPGDGRIAIIFDGKVLSKYNITTGNGQPSSIEENVKTYTFVAAVEESPVRRDETDVE